ncbi:hypothetical protein TIFTF001_046290 [Ficus carica]|uniref:S-protein homolog n=1 Tax=Ficus carica TaxID=3494 RepID=A0AA87Z3I5_FICCA|nr:hypothetical protein TIFTF001_046290 [Ficus carica]
MLNSSTTCQGVNPTVRVTILNNLSNIQNLLIVHCKSKDDDLRTQIVASNKTYEWEFRVNIFKSALFYCAFNWGNVAATFDMFIAKRDEPRCRTLCVWVARDQGVFGYTEIGHVNDLTFPWPTPPSSHAK